MRPILFFIVLILSLNLQAQHHHRGNDPIVFPDIPGYLSLKTDLHQHTVFSDGTVWPTVRVEEAWKEGLDAIAITDHIEYRPHSVDVVSDHNRSYEIAEPLAKQSNILLVRSAEITRSMPPGHLNALFIKNANLLEREDVVDALKEARHQGAFIMWNHPGWKAQQPDTTLWWDEHSHLLENDLLHGIEVYNESSFYPEALRWAKDKKLTPLACSDVHGPMDTADGHRPMTLVFAKSRTLAGLKEAMFSGRALAYFENTLVGSENLLEALFFASIKIEKQLLKLVNEESATVYIHNNSDIDYELELLQPGVGFNAPDKLKLKAHHIAPLTLTGNSDEVNTAKNLDVYYHITNMYTASDENLVITLTLRNN